MWSKISQLSSQRQRRDARLQKMKSPFKNHHVIYEFLLKYHFFSEQYSLCAGSRVLPSDSASAEEIHVICSTGCIPTLLTLLTHGQGQGHVYLSTTTLCTAVALVPHRFIYLFNDNIWVTDLCLCIFIGYRNIVLRGGEGGNWNMELEA